MTHSWWAFGSTRVALIVLGYLTLTFFPAHPVESWQGIVFPGNNWIDGWVRWDSMWYEHIVNNQPRFIPAGHSSANFFPLYSFVSWTAGLPLRALLDHERAFYVGGWFVSSASFLLGLIAVYRLAVKLAGADVAVRTVWLIAVFPFSFFLTAVYADAFYFCLAAWSLLCAYEGRWPQACVLAVMASMTRIPGLALYPAIVLEYLRQHEFKFSAIWRQWPSWAILIAGPILILGYHEWRYGDPLAFLHARQQGWKRASGLLAWQRDVKYFFQGSIAQCGGVAECLREFDTTRHLLGYWYVALIPVSAAAVIYASRTIGVGLSVWALTSIAMAMVNGLDGTGRFTSVLFPAFIGLAMLLRTRATFLAACACFVPFLVLFFAQFARWKQVL